MKKMFLVGALALFGLTKAQVNFGVKGGYSLSQMSISNSSGTDFNPEARHSFYVGGLAEYRLGDVALQGEVLYSPIGAVEKRTVSALGSNLTAKLKYDLQTIQVPISVKYYLIDGLGVLGGLNVGFNMGSKVKSEVDTNISGLGSLASLANREMDLQVKTLNLAPFIGAEYDFGGLFIDARYNFGITDISKNQENQVYRLLGISDFKAKSSFLQVGIGYKF